MVKLSVCMIVKNEENHLDMAMDSVLFADEKVICDTGSVDGTVGVASVYTDRVYTDYTWKDDFADARNHALSKCTGDWVLSLDADEVLVSSIDQVKFAIEEAIANGHDAVECVLTASGGQNQHKIARIFANHPSVRWQGEIHECIMARSVYKPQAPIHIEYGYSTAHYKDPDRSLRILKAVCEKRPNSIRERYYLAREYWYRNEYQEALNHYMQYIPVSNFLYEKADAYLMAARCAWMLQDGNTARQLVIEAIKINPDFKEALRFCGDIHFDPWKSKWHKLADHATNQDVLFIRQC